MCHCAYSALTFWDTADRILLINRFGVFFFLKFLTIKFLHIFECGLKNTENPVFLIFTTIRIIWYICKYIWVWKWCWKYVQMKKFAICPFRLRITPSDGKAHVISSQRLWRNKVSDVIVVAIIIDLHQRKLRYLREGISSIYLILWLINLYNLLESK